MFSDEDETEDDEKKTGLDDVASGDEKKGKKGKKEQDYDGMSLMDIVTVVDDAAPDTISQADKASTAYLRRFSSGIFDVDVALGGGWVWGGFCRVFGPSSKGKTTLVLKSIGMAQNYCRYCRFMFIPNAETGELTCVCPPKCKDCDQKFIKRQLTPDERAKLIMYRKDTKTKTPTKQVLFDFLNFFDEHTCGCASEAGKPKITERAGIVRVNFVDIEETFTADWCRKMGAKPELILLSIPEYAEQGINVINALIRSRQIDIVALDSLAAMTPTAEVEAAVEENQMMVAARLFGRAFRKWRQAIGRMGLHQNKPMLFIINQLRTKGGANKYTPGGDETTPGGRAQEYFSSIDVKVTATYQMSEKGNAVYADTKILVKKNKTAPAMKRASYRFYYQPRDGHPVGDTDELAVVGGAALDYGIIQRKGPVYKFRNYTWKTQKAFIEKLSKDSILFAEIREKSLAAALKREVDPRAIQSFEEPVTLDAAPEEEVSDEGSRSEEAGDPQDGETGEAPGETDGGADKRRVRKARSKTPTRKW